MDKKKLRKQLIKALPPVAEPDASWLEKQGGEVVEYDLSDVDASSYKEGTQFRKNGREVTEPVKVTERRVNKNINRKKK